VNRHCDCGHNAVVKFNGIASNMTEATMATLGLKYHVKSLSVVFKKEIGRRVTPSIVPVPPIAPAVHNCEGATKLTNGCWHSTRVGQISSCTIVKNWRSMKDESMWLSVRRPDKRALCHSLSAVGMCKKRTILCTFYFMYDLHCQAVCASAKWL
jgi:hypothetical protein